MRTRLDEIVEEVLNDYPTAAGYTASGKMRAVAERAFRYGVEIGVGEATLRLTPIDPRTVQPAPAGEKCWCGWSGNHAHVDRRKGERRKPGPCEHRLSHYVCSGCGCVYKNRRSGKDRRQEVK